MTAKKNILVINAGSSSDKIAFFQLDEKAVHNSIPLQPDWQTEIDFPSGDIDAIHWQQLLTEALQPLLNGTVVGISPRQMTDHSVIDIIGYRVVHGGDKYSCAVAIDDAVKKDIKKYMPLAPLHNKVSLAQINALEKLLPKAKQIAVFDTAFHRTIAEIFSFYPIPYDWHEKYGIKRYGFHGINHQYCARQAASILKKDLEQLSLITCHLGSGCSLTAIDKGKSVNTTMGFTPLEGLMMASRSGSIDPGILLYLLKNNKMTAEQLEIELNRNSGLKGISKTNGDMKKIIEQMQSKATKDQLDSQGTLATLAFDMFIAHLRAEICAMRASLHKLDAIIFSGGIGENSELVRQKTCAGLEFLGTENILVIKAREDWAIAQQCLLLK